MRVRKNTILRAGIKTAKLSFAPLHSFSLVSRLLSVLREKKISIPCFFILAMLAIAPPPAGIYDINVKTIEGPQKQLSGYQGKKMLFITLPLVRTNAADSFLVSVDSLAGANQATLKIITVPSVEDGYTSSQKQALKNWYRQFLDSSVVITTGMYTRKTSGSQQHKLFKWLTHQSRNGYFNEDVDGPGMKFMVRANGELMGVLKKRSRLGGAAMQRMLQAQ